MSKQNDSVSGFSPIAIVGVSALFPGSQDATGFWRDILAGRDLIRDVPPTHWRIEDYYDPDPAAPDKTYARRGAFIDPIDFDALAWGVPPSNIPATDTSQLLALIAAQAVLQDAAGEQFEHMDRSRISVILGVTSAQELLFSMVSRLQRPVWVKALREGGLPEDEVQAACDRIAANYVPWQESSFPGLLGNVVAGRIANRLNLGGTNCVTDAACASSFSALSMAVNELQLGHSDLVIAGGVDTLNDIFMYMCFSKTPALSPSGDCRPFSDQADGTMLGEGLGMVAIKRLADAERDGDRVYAVIRGIGTSSDGRSKSVYAPVSEGQAQALRRAYQQAGYGPETVELMEAHGTGTKAGDVAEFEGLRQVYAPAAPQRAPWCALGSVKSQIGHTKAAAGAAGLFKAVMALHHQVLPPSIKVKAPNPKLGLDRSPFYLNTRARPWIRDSRHPRRASVSAFGFGGSNFHVTVEEYTGPATHAPRMATRQFELIALSAASAAELTERIVALGDSTGSFECAAAKSRRDFDPSAAHRLLLVAGSRAQLQSSLEAARSRIAAAPATAFTLPDGTAYGVGPADGALALLFPGQGSQYLEMGAGLAMQLPIARAVWDRAADLPLDPELGLHEVVFPQPRFDAAAEQADSNRLTATYWAQPAIAATSLSQLAVLNELGVQGDLYAGHSFGEITALHAAGVISHDDTLRIARQRGERMAAAASVPGGMLALGLPRAEVEALLVGHDELVIANHNAPRQVIVSGPESALQTWQAKLTEQGVAAKRLAVATAFHSSVVAEACAPFGEFLQQVQFAAPTRPVYSNALAAAYPSAADAQRALLAGQIAQPVRFVEVIDAMYAAGARCFLEVGPGGVLTGLVGAILGERPHTAIALDRKGRDGLESLLLGLARLGAAGVAMNLGRLFAHERAAIEQTPRSRHALPITGSNVGKPYPPQDPTTLPAPNPPRPLSPPIAPAPALAAPAVAPPASAPIAAPAAASMPPELAAAWVQAFQQTQQQTAAAHSAFQQAMFDSHRSYLQLAEQSLGSLAGMLGVAPGAMSAGLPSLPIAAPILSPAAAPPVLVASPVTPLAPAASVSAAAPLAPQAAVQPATPAAVQSVPIAPAPSMPVTPASTPELSALLLRVVADKTGYPVDMLNLDMDLEGDLGVDSIKRVEILAALEDAAPQLSRSDRAALAGLHTLREIVDHLGLRSTPAAGNAAAPVAVASSARGTAPDLEALMLAVVAEKTGYPADMLNLGMDLEGDLGVDSIKRVEILAALEERVSDLPKLDRAALSALHTLAEIVGYLRSLSGSGSAAAASPGAAAAPALKASSITPDLEGLMLAVVAEKTGYPADMLNLGMDLEGDLGVDSIKRVEILAALEERVADMPKLDRTALSALHTLGEIVDFMRRSAAPVAAKANGLLHSTSAGVASVAATVSTASAAPAALGRYRLQRLPVPATGLAMPELLGGKRVWICGGSDVAQPLADALRGRGVNALVSDAPPITATACVYLGGLRDCADRSAAMAINREAFQLARRLGKAMQTQRGLLVTVQDSGGQFAVGNDPGERAWLAGLPALVKTAALEWPKLAAKAIDIDRGERSAADIALALADELLAGGGEIEVALAASGERSTLVSRAETVLRGESVIAAGDLVVVSGGARGVTAACLEEWAGRVKPKLLLLGRSELAEEPACCAGIDGEAALKARLLAAAADPVPPTPKQLQARVQAVLQAREVRRNVAALEAAGAVVRYAAVDVQDAAALDALLTDVRSKWGPVRGLVHAAGVLADKRIVDKTDDKFDPVFDTKVQGLAALLDATRADPLRLLCVFSSVSARCGNTGQADYAMANEVLAKVAAAEARRRPGLRSKALCWGPWEGGMVSPALRARFAELGVPMIPLQVGAQMFADEMDNADAEAIELVLGGEPRPEALLVDGAKARVLALEIKVAALSHDYLRGHAVNGMPVVPAVLVAEWMTRAARSFRPGMADCALHDFKVLKGIRLGHFDQDEGDQFIIEASPLSLAPGRIALQMLVKDAHGTPFYSARAELAVEAAVGDRGLPELSLDPWPQTPLYQHLLFHRGDFELIDQMEGISDHGVGATVRGVDHAGWTHEPWQLDVAALDGGLQLAVLYGQRMLGGLNLPTAIEELRVFGDRPARGPIRAAVYRRHAGSHAVTTDILLSDAGGRRLAELRGVQNHAVSAA